MQHWIAGILLLSVGGAWAGLTDEISPEDFKKMEAGETIVTSKSEKGDIWPEVTLYRIVNAKPSEVAHLFEDYENAPKYIPDMLAAEVVDQPKPNVKDVRYTVKFPILSKASYTVRNEYKKSGHTHTVEWNLLQSPLAKSSQGSLVVEPYDGQTLLRYRNNTQPITSLVGGLKNQALKEAQKTVDALATEAERRSGKN